MKLHTFIIELSATLVLFSSCEGFLDPKAETDLTQEFANISYNNTLARSVGMYSYLPNGLLYIDDAMMASASDEAEHTLETAAIQKFNAGSWTPNDNPDSESWDRNFQGIYATNLFLAESDEVNLDYLKNDSNSVSQGDYQERLNNIARWQYEARFLRAYYYFELIKRYGGVPIITEPMSLDSDLANYPRATLGECIDFIVNECDTTAKYLPSPDRMVDRANNLGRATKGAALGLKCRVLLYAASELFNNPDAWAPGYAHKELISLSGKTRQERWEQAAAAANEFMTSLGTRYELGAYRDTRLFDSPEIIFTRRFGASNEFEKANYPVGYEQGKSGTTPSQNLVDAYEMTDGSKFSWDNPEHKANPYANRDPRLAMTVLTNDAPFKGDSIESYTGGRNGKGVTWATKTGYYLYKYIDPDLDLLQNRTSVHTWVIMRFSEMLLNHAEAMNEAYGPTVRPSGFRSTNALTSVNRVRERADVQLPPIPEDVTEEQLREIIRHERQVELAFEDHRCWDVRRWMIAPSTLGAPLRGVEITKTGDDSYTYEPIIVEQRVFEPKMYLYPIPQADLNTTGWPQNPLW